MHGRGCVIWPDGRKYEGVTQTIYHTRNTMKMLNMEEAYLNGEMVENTKASG